MEWMLSQHKEKKRIRLRIQVFRDASNSSLDFGFLSFHWLQRVTYCVGECDIFVAPLCSLPRDKDSSGVSRVSMGVSYCEVDEEMLWPFILVMSLEMHWTDLYGIRCGSDQMNPDANTSLLRPLQTHSGQQPVISIDASRMTTQNSSSENG